jgi:hypothetical protein
VTAAAFVPVLHTIAPLKHIALVHSMSGMSVAVLVLVYLHVSV